MDARTAASSVSPVVPAAAGCPWWIVLAVVLLSSGSRWAMGWLDVRDRTRPLKPLDGVAYDAGMALVVTCKHGRPLRLGTADATEIVVKVWPGHGERDARVIVDAPRSVVVERRERD